MTTEIPTRQRDTLFSALVGLASLGILLQAVWAGMFVRPGQAFDDFWVTVHARGAEVTIALALAAAVVGFWRLRARRDLVGGSAALAVLLALMALAVWLPFRARRGSELGG